jgi:hypothetical protein
LFGGAEEEVSEGDGVISTMLEQIRNANLNNENILSVNFKNKRGAYSSGIEIYKGLKIKVGMAVSGTDIKLIHPRMSECSLNLHKQITAKDYFMYIANMFGDFFDIKEFSGSVPYRTFIFHEPQTVRYISLTVEEKYSNIFGNYLFGKNWDYQHLSQDRNWVLHIYSPWFSEKFNAARGNLIEQRRLIYLALGQV